MTVVDSQVLPRLIATDLDGTLLGVAGAVSARTADVMRRSSAAGAAVILVTGRTQRRLADVYDQLGAEDLSICANGAVVYDPMESAVLTCRPMSPGVAREVCGRLRERAPQVIFAAHVDSGHRMVHEPGWPVRGTAHGRSMLARVEDLFSEPVVKLQARALGHEPERFVELVAEMVSDLAEVTTQGYQGLVELSDRGVTKASALAAIADGMGVAASEVLAFGDMPNDVSMLRWAGRSVAVNNAHPLARAAAKETTLANVEDRVAAYLEKVLRRSP